MCLLSWMASKSEDVIRRGLYANTQIIKRTTRVSPMIKLAGISDARHQRIVAVLAVCLATSSIVSAEDVVRVAPLTPLDHGFSGLYNLDFAGAQKDFAAWQAQHPADPVGPVSEAAGLLFSEFNRLG